MSFVEAFKFPLKNLPKVLTIALAYAIFATGVVLLAQLMGTDTNTVFSEQPNLSFIHLCIVLAQMLFLGGYGLRVIRRLMDGHEILPKIQFLSDLNQGVMVTFAGIYYLIPMFIWFALFSLIDGLSGASSTSLMDGLFILVTLLLGLTLAFSFIVGMARYAIDEKTEDFFALTQNVGIVRMNFGATFSLAVYQFGLGVIYLVITFGAGLVLALVIGILGINPNKSIIAYALLTVIYTTFEIMRNFASLHLIAQYAQRIGLSPNKQKQDDLHNLSF